MQEAQSSKYTESLATVNNECKSLLSKVKSDLKSNHTQEQTEALNNAIHKFKKYREIKSTLGDSKERKSLEKQLIKKLQRLIGKVQEIGKGVSSKAAKHVKFNKAVKTVTFNQDDALDVAKRTWNDGKNRKEKLSRGQFDEKEVKTLMNSICNYIAINDKTEEDLIALCSKSKEDLNSELKGAWCVIAEALPNRSVQSCHNFCRRKFNPNNYNGKWSKLEEEFMLDHIKETGH